MDRIDALQVFIAVARESGFSKAADKLGLSNQLVSKYVQQLEADLKVRLFNRTTRKVSLTEAGEQCFQRAVQILEGFTDMRNSVDELHREATGLLRISAPVTFATNHLSVLLRDFCRQHPQVNIDLHLNDRTVDLLEEGFDVALRIGHLKSSALIAKRIAPIRLVFCAAPDYIRTHGPLNHPEDLIPDDHLNYSYLNLNTLNTDLHGLYTQRKKARITANNGEILKDLAVAGAGYTLQPTFIVGEAIRSGALNVILKGHEPEPMGLYALYPHRQLLATKVRAFIDFIENYYGETPYWDG